VHTCTTKRAYQEVVPRGGQVLGERQHQALDPFAHRALARDALDHAPPDLLHPLVVPVHDRADELLLRAEVVADRRVVALARGLADLPAGDRRHAVLGEQPLGRRHDRLARPGGLPPAGPHGPRAGLPTAVIDPHRRSRLSGIHHTAPRPRPHHARASIVTH
jgi:hypothetical protein